MYNKILVFILQKRLHKLSGLVLLFLVMMPYQNCTTSSMSSIASKKSSSTGDSSGNPDNPPPPLPVAPAAGGLKIDLSYVNKNSTQYTRFKNFVDRALAGRPDYGFEAYQAAYMHKLTYQGLPNEAAPYCQYAIQFIETCPNNQDQGPDCGVQAAERIIASGGRPPVSGDSYLEAGPIIGSLAITYDWCNQWMTETQKSRWAAYVNQTITNIWDPSRARWGNNPYPWTGWGTNDPGNNYFYSFVTATMYWALATNDTALLNTVRNDKLNAILNYYSQIPGGGSLEGTGYGNSHMVLFNLYQVWKDSTGENIANLNSHMSDTIRLFLHLTTPDRAHYAPFGDLARSSTPDLFDYHRRLILSARHQTMNVQLKDLGAWWLSHISVNRMGRDVDSQWDMIPAGTNNSLVPDEPLVYYAQGIGRVFARTGWDTSALWVNFNAGKYNQSHAHQDQGSFTLANNNFLTVTNNIYSQSGINQTTEYHNVLKFLQNGNIVPQRESNTLASTLTINSQNGTTGSVDATANLTPAYGTSQNAVTNWMRRFQFSNRTLTVTDNYTVSANTRAVFQINTPVAPVVSYTDIIVGYRTDPNGLTVPIIEREAHITAGSLKIKVETPRNPTVNIISQIDNVTVGRTDPPPYTPRFRIEISGGTNQFIVQMTDQ